MEFLYAPLCALAPSRAHPARVPRSQAEHSAAQPGQGGTGHINEQTTEYWMESFVAFAFVFDPVKTDTLRNGFAANGAAPWFERNTIALMPSS